MDETKKLGDISLGYVAEVFEDLPIVTRIEFVKLICVGRRGDVGSEPSDPAMVLAVEVLDGVIALLEDHPRRVLLGFPEP